MGTTTILGISHTDTMLQLNGLQEIGLPMVGGSYGAAESVVDNYNNRAESVTISTIPEMYRVMTREVRGEEVVEMSYAGQTTFNLGLYPVTENTLHLYLDYGRAASSSSGTGALPAVNVYHADDGGEYGSPGHTPYAFRDLYDRISTDNYTVDTETGAVTLVDMTLAGGSKVYADYKHTAMSRCHNLRDIAIRLAAANFGSSLSGLTDSARDFLMQMEQAAMNQLYSIMRGEAGIDLLDQVKLIDETRQGFKIPRRGFSLFM